MKDFENIDITDNDFLIVIRPKITDNEWVGEVDVSVVSSGKSVLGDEDYFSMLQFTRMVCASIPLMEEDKNVRDACEEMARHYMSDSNVETEEEQEDYLTVESKDGNVIKLAFNSKTGGNA
tara:strand:+ start:91 stop:453 length:363 start_codon:yes stop_codon:yes gene_type:complete